MIRLAEMDPNVSVADQLQDTGGAVILINSITVAAQEIDQFIDAWTDDAAYFRRQPGFISTQLHRGIAGSCVFVNVAVWESTLHFRSAFTRPEFQAKLARYPASSVVTPHLFRKVAVPGICVD